MLFRFSLYGFLKNQRYFESFIILAFLQKGLSFSTIGFLIGFKEICINLLEIPTGAIADVTGRRRAMILSFIAYLFSFYIFGISENTPSLFLAMFLFSIGDAFRTGTHKAIIFDWLKKENRENEKVKIYGYTRSWSKIGSALGVAVAAILMYFSDDYSIIFLLSMIPAFLNIINFLTYPSYLEGKGNKDKTPKQVIATLMTAVKQCVTKKELRRILIESTNYEGLYKVSKDYLQPVIQAAALSLPIFLTLNENKRTAILIGIVYSILYLISSFASRKAGSFSDKQGGEKRASKILWFGNIIIFSIMLLGIILGQMLIVILAFVLFALAQNLWRPVLISRCATLADDNHAATVLSVESQTKSFFVAIAAPPLGFCIDWIGNVNPQYQFLPLALLGLVITAIIIITNSKK